MTPDLTQNLDGRLLPAALLSHTFLIRNFFSHPDAALPATNSAFLASTKGTQGQRPRDTQMEADLGPHE